MAGMGFEVGKFMPLKGRTPLPVPAEISLVLEHLCAIIGATQPLSRTCPLAAPRGNLQGRMARKPRVGAHR